MAQRRPASPSPRPDAGHAVVIGGGMAGLLATGVCAQHFLRVTLVERDVLDDTVATRRGVPQGRLLHALLPGGLRIIEQMFPGYSRALEMAGAVPIHVPGDILMLLPPGWADRRASGWTTLSASRPLLELMVRVRVRANARVQLLDGHDVTGLRADRGGTVRGVAVRSIAAHASGTLDADLVVDAAGRASRAPAWLEELGASAPPETVVDPDIAYACQVLRIPRGLDVDWKALMLLSRPPVVPRTGYLFPIESGHWMASLMGAAGQHPPTDPEGFMTFARSLRHPILADAIAGAEPVTPARAHRGTANRLRHYERVAMPDGLVVLGDAACAFNPVYGQGISTAAIAARTLDECLRRRRRQPGDELGLTGLAAKFQRRLARRNGGAWLLSTGEDLRFPTTTGGRTTAGTRLLHRYVDRVAAASTREPGAADAYARVIGMLSRPTSLFAPGVVAAALRARTTEPSAPPPRAPDEAPAVGVHRTGRTR